MDWTTVFPTQLIKHACDAEGPWDIVLGSRSSNWPEPQTFRVETSEWHIARQKVTPQGSERFRRVPSRFLCSPIQRREKIWNLEPSMDRDVKPKFYWCRMFQKDIQPSWGFYLVYLDGCLFSDVDDFGFVFSWQASFSLAVDSCHSRS